MYYLKYAKAFLITSLFVQSTFAISENVIFRLPNEECAYVELPSSISLVEVQNYIEGISGISKEQLLIIADREVQNGRDVIYTHEGQEIWVIDKSQDSYETDQLLLEAYSGNRNYENVLTKPERKELCFILKTLALKSLVSLWSYKSQLESAGARIDHVHPLKIFQTIFLDEELKSYLFSIKKRGGVVWNQFIKGYEDAFQNEANKGNITDQHLSNFSAALGIDIALLKPHVSKQKWEDLVKTLIANISRNENSGRYDQ